MKVMGDQKVKPVNEGRNDRLGCGREEMDAREWRGGQKVGSNQDQSGFLDQEV